MTRELCRFRYPVDGAMVIWEVTRYCNLACLHCCTDSDPQVSRENDLPLRVIKDSISAMTDAGVTEYYFSGGEPLSRKDFPEIVSAVDPAQAEVYVNTNGYYLTPAMAKKLARTALRWVTISIDGADRDVHAIFRGKPRSYDRAIAAVKASIAAGLRVRVSHVVGAPNVTGVRRFVRQMLDLGVGSIVVNTVFPAGRAARHPAIHLAPEQVVELEATLVELATECKNEGVKLDFSLGEPAAAHVPPGCPAGRRVLYVAPDGSVSGCSWLFKLDPARFSIGNLRHERFGDLMARLEGQNQMFASHDSCPLPTLTSTPS